MQLGAGLLSAYGLGNNSNSTTQEVSLDESADTISLSNSDVSVQFNAETGGIRQLLDGEGNGLRNESGPAPDSVWGLQFYSTEYDNVLANSWRTENPEISTSKTDDEVRFTATWTDPPVKAPEDPQYSPTFEGEITVTASVRAGEPRVYWDFSVKNQGEMAIRAARCPYITNIDGLGNPKQASIILPSNTGRKINNPIPIDAYAEVRYPSGFGTMQFTAFTGADTGFYFDARDVEGYTKHLRWGNQWTGDDHIFFQHEFLVPRRSGGDVTVPYQATTGPTAPSWYDAADNYRAWLESSELISENQTFPKWYLDRGATFHARSYDRPSQSGDQHVSFEETADRTVSLREQLGVPLQFRWWGYQRHGNFGGGDWFPPKEGWDAFDRVVSRLQEHDVTLLGFAMTNVILESSDLWQEQRQQAKQWLSRKKNQEPWSYSSLGQTRYEPEITQAGWQKKLHSVYRKLVEHGAKQVQVDGFPWTGTPECYSDQHDHPPGYGGNWFARGARAWLTQLREDLKVIDDSILISGEGFADFYLSQLDISASRDVRAERQSDDFQTSDIEVIPLAQYTLGDSLAFRGENHFPLVDADWTEPPQYLRLVIGRSIEWGMLPLFRVAVQTPEHIESESLLEFLERVASVFHRHGTRFIIQGQLQRTPSIDVPLVRTHCKGLEGNQVDVTADSVLQSVWKTSVLGVPERAAMFANISPEPQTITLKRGHLGSENDLVYTVVNGEYSRLNDAIREGEEELELPVRSIVLVVSTQNTEVMRQALQEINRVQEENLEDIDRAIEYFVKGRPSDAVSYLNSLQDTPTDSPGSTTNQSIAGDSQEENSSTRNRTVTEVPGFSVLEAIGGIVAAIFAWLHRGNDQD